MDLSLEKSVSGKSCRVLAPAHMTKFVRPPLERDDSAADRGADKIVRLKRLLIYQLVDISSNGDVIHHLVSRAPPPVLESIRSAGDICRRIDKIFWHIVLDIE